MVVPEDEKNDHTHSDCSLEVIKQNLKNRNQIGLGIESNILVHLSEA